MEDVDVVLLFGLFFYFPVVVMAPAFLTMAVVVIITTVVYGLFYSFSSAAADVMVDAATIAVSKPAYMKITTAARNFHSCGSSYFSFHRKVCFMSSFFKIHSIIF